MICYEPSGLVHVTGLVCASSARVGTPSVFIQPEDDSGAAPYPGAAPYRVASRGLEAELGHIVGERLMVRGRLARRQRAKRQLNVSSYGIITSGQ